MIKEKDNLIEYKRVIDKDMLEDVKILFLDYAGSLSIDLGFQDFNTELKGLPGKYAPPDGVIILATVNAQVAGCVALRKIENRICEMKRLYVRDMYRGLRIGKGLIEAIISEARILNYDYMRLDTLSTMEKAQSLYRSLGFYEILPYIFNPIQDAKFMELKLN